MIPYFEAFNKYGVFCGRARLWEYWGFWIIHIVVSIGVIMLGIIITGGDDQSLTLLLGFYLLAVFVPGIAVTVRRLHDIGHSGWWYFLFFVPLIGPIVLLIWLTRDGQPGPNKYGLNPLEAAKRCLKRRVDVNAKCEDGRTPLHLAAGGGQKADAVLLIGKGADVNAKDNNGHTPLHLAAGNGHKEVAALLIAKGADANAKDDTGATPLGAAAYYGHKDVAELLLAKGADVNATTREGFTPVYIAVLKGHKDISDLLKKHGGLNTVFSICRKCSKKTSKAGNYTNMHLSGILDPVDFDNKYGMMCGDHAGDVTEIIMKEKSLSKCDWVAANQKALKALEQDLM